MNMRTFGEHFFTPGERIPEGVGYGIFTPAHFMIIAMTVLVTVIVAHIYRRSDWPRKVMIRRIIAATLVISNVLKFSLLIANDIDISAYLPLEICSFAVLAIVCDSIWPRERFLKGMLLLVFLPGGIMALLFPVTTHLPLFNIYALQSLIYHGLIIVYIIALYCSGEMAVTYKDLWKAVLKTCVLASVIYVIDVVTDSNFMFLRGTEGNFMLEIIRGVTGDGVGYLIGLVVFVILVIHIFFVIFKVLEKVFLRK